VTYAVDVVEVAVGFILVLFVEFGCVESFVVEFVLLLKDEAVGLPRSLSMRTRPYQKQSVTCQPSKKARAKLPLERSVTPAARWASARETLSAWLGAERATATGSVFVT